MLRVLMMLTGVLLMQADTLAQIKVKVGSVSLRIGGSRLKHARTPKRKSTNVSLTRILTRTGGLLRHRNYAQVRHVYRGRLHHSSGGYWKIVKEKVWVPPVYRYVRGRYGHLTQVCVRAGYYEYVEKQIWVPVQRHRSHGRHSRDGHDRRHHRRGHHR